MTAEELINAINSMLPLSNVSKTTFDGEKPEKFEYWSKSPIVFNADRIAVGNEIENLIFNTNVNYIGIGSINFRNTFRPHDDSLFEFASYNDFNKICLDTSSNRIMSFVESFDELEEISGSIEDFLYFLYLCELYHCHVVYHLKISKKDLRHELTTLINKGFSEQCVKDLIFDWPLNE